MYRVMVIDDETFVRKSIINRIDWQKLNLNVVAEADNGQDAYNLALEIKPEIMLVDIKMPLMNGIELISLVRKTLPNTQFIILSGYSDFEYTKEAIKLGVVNYIKKPIDKKELEETLLIIIDKLNKIDFNQQQMTELSLQAQKSIKEKQLRYLQQLVHNSISVTDKIIKFEGEYFALILIYTTNVNQSYPVMENFREIIQHHIEQYLKINSMHIPPINTFVFYSQKPVNILCILLNSNQRFDDSLLLQMSRSIVQLAHCSMKENFCDCQLFVSIGGVVKEYTYIPKIYNQALYLMKHKILYNNTSIFSQEIVYKQINKNNNKEFWGFLYNTLEMIYRAIENRNFNEVNLILNNIFSKENRDKFTIEMLETIIIQIDSILKKIMILYDIKSLDFLNDDTFSTDCILKHNSISELKNSIYSCIYNLYSKYPQLHDVNIVDRIKHYVKIHYSENINVNQIAKEFYINPNYLSQLFKKTTGINLSRYIEDTRISMSIKLLSNVNTKVRDVAISVGYHDPNYFSKIFKKHTGMTPIEYQNQQNR